MYTWGIKGLYAVFLFIFLTNTGAFSAPTEKDAANMEAIEAIGEAVSEEEKPENTQANSLPAPDGEGKSLFSTIMKGGWMMLPVLGLLLLGMTFIVERCVFYYRSRIWDLKVFENHLTEKAEVSKAAFKEELDNELRDVSQIYVNELEKGLNLIHGIGNLSPLLGFFGTVVGMIDAFAAIAAAATVNAKVVAEGIEIALVTTAGGLAVAVPMLAFYYLFAHFVQTHYNEADRVINLLTADRPSWANKTN